MRILGIDPGLKRTGFGIIDADGPRLGYVGSGTIVVPGDTPLAQRLKVILDSIREIVDTHRPDVAVIEKVFVNVNPSSTLLLGQARGAAMCALADRHLDVHEYTALQVKKSVVGTGHAAKEQVQHMVQHLLSLSGLPAADSADALACAICHAHVAPLGQKLQATGQFTTTRGRSRLRGGRFLG